MTAQQRIGVFFNPTGISDSGAFAGARAYAEENTDWRLIPIADKSRIPQASKLSLHLDGLLMGGWMTHRIDRVPELPLALWFKYGSDRPGTNGDFHQAGLLAAEHMVPLGLDRFLYAPALDQWGNPELRAGFQSGLKRRGRDCAVMPEGSRVRRHGWNLERQVADWMAVLKKQTTPLGILAFDEIHGERVELACEAAGLRVPEDVALMVATANPDFCGICTPPVTCVVLRPYDMGHAAAGVLDDLLNGADPGKSSRLVAPATLLARESTRAVFTDDATLARVLDWMDARPPSDWTVGGMMEVAYCSRMTLFRRFRERLGCSPSTYIQRRRVILAKELLLAGDEPVLNLAMDCGFTDSPHFIRHFKRDTGLTPGAYRKKYRSPVA